MRIFSYCLVSGILLLILGCATGNINVSVNPLADQAKVRKVAVLDFAWEHNEKEREDLGDFTGTQVFRPKDAGRVVADIFASELLGLGRYRMVERTEIEKILQEHNLEQSGLLQGAKIEDIGDLLKVDGLVLGRVAKYSWYRKLSGSFHGSGVSFSVRLVDTHSGEIIWSGSVSRSADFKHVEQLSIETCRQLVKQLARHLQKGG